MLVLAFYNRSLASMLRDFGRGEVSEPPRRLDFDLTPSNSDLAPHYHMLCMDWSKVMMMYRACLISGCLTNCLYIQ